MKRNVYLILITVITILCIIAGTGYHLVRFGLSVAEGLPFFSEFIEAISDWDDDDDDSDDNDDSDNGISTSVDASQKNLDAFSSINADLNVVDLTIQRGNTFSITCKASKLCDCQAVCQSPQCSRQKQKMLRNHHGRRYFNRFKTPYKRGRC